MNRVQPRPGDNSWTCLNVRTPSKFRNTLTTIRAFSLCNLSRKKQSARGRRVNTSALHPSYYSCRINPRTRWCWFNGMHDDVICHLTCNIKRILRGASCLYSAFAVPAVVSILHLDDVIVTHYNLRRVNVLSRPLDSRRLFHVFPLLRARPHRGEETGKSFSRAEREQRGFLFRSGEHNGWYSPRLPPIKARVPRPPYPSTGCLT